MRERIRKGKAGSGWERKRMKSFGERDWKIEKVERKKRRERHGMERLRVRIEKSRRGKSGKR